MDKAFFFIDGSNFYKGIKSEGGSGWDATHIDLMKFCASIIDSADYRIIRIYYYDAPLRQEWDQKRYSYQQQFFQRLRSQNNIELRLGRLQGRYPNIVEKGVDVMLSVDLIRFARNDSFDCGILLTADADYIPAIQLVKDMGKTVCNAYFPNRASFHIRNHADRFLPIDFKMVLQNQLPKLKKPTL